MNHPAEPDQTDSRLRLERARRNTRRVWWAVAIFFGAWVAYGSTR